MFIDIHVHPDFYEPICADEGAVSLRHAKMDIHKNGKAKLGHIYNQMRCAGLDRLCLLAQDHNTVDGRPLVTNEEVAQLAALSDGRFFGFASVDPFDPAAAGKLEYAFSALGLRGLKLNPGKQGYYPPDLRLAPLYDICEKYNKPVLFHSGLSWEPGVLSKFCRPVEFEELAARRPALRFCLGHFGWPWVQETAMLLVKYPNVYADTGILYFDSADEFYKRVFTQDIPATWIDRSLRHQVMFGSNNPRFEQIRMAGALDKLGLRESTLELIKGENALAFLGEKEERA